MSAIGSTPDASAILLGDGFGGGHHPRRGWTGAAILISRSVETSARTEFARQASATARLIDAELPPEGARLGDDGTRLVQILRDVALIGGHEFVEAAVVGPRGTVTVLGAGGGFDRQGAGHRRPHGVRELRC